MYPSMICALFLFGSAAAHGEPSDVLLAALRAAYPGVVRWHVEPLTTRRSRDAELDPSAGAVVTTLGSRSAVRVSSPDAKGRMRSRAMWFAVAGFQPVLVATRHLNARSLVEREAVATHEADVVGLGCTPVLAVEQVLGKRTRSAVAAHRPFCAEALEPAPAVARGQEVDVRYLGDAVAVMTKAIAQSDAGHGERVLVRRVPGNEVFPARVSGPREVTVHE